MAECWFVCHNCRLLPSESQVLQKKNARFRRPRVFHIGTHRKDSTLGHGASGVAHVSLITEPSATIMSCHLDRRERSFNPLVFLRFLAEPAEGLKMTSVQGICVTDY